jgi:hypothetical protein
LRDYVGKPDQAQKLLAGIDRVLNIAGGDDDKQAISAMKLLLDRVMPAMPLKEAEDAERTDRRLEIIIRTNPNAKVPVQAVIDGEFTEIQEETPCPTKKQDSPPTPSKAERALIPSTTKVTTPSQSTSAKKSVKAKRRSRKPKSEPSK